MKVVVLDGYAANPGDLSWEGFRDFGELTVYDRTLPQEAAKRIGDAEIVLTNKVAFDEDLFSKCPNLKYIGIMATGYNIIDIDAAARRGVTVCNVPGYSTDSVAQEVFAFMLNFSNSVAKHSDSVHAGEWQNSRDFSYQVAPVFELAGKTLGVVGYGAIGRRSAEIGRAFGMRVLAYSRHLSQADCPDGVVCADLDTLFAKSDFITLHCPLNDESRGMIGTKNINKMKDGVYIINTARGGLVNEAELAAALQSKKVAGAGVDVALHEPINGDSPLLSAPNCVITPHIAWATYEARVRLMKVLYDNMSAFVAGKPINKVN